MRRWAYPREQHCIVVEAQQKTLDTPRPKSNTEGSSIQRDEEGYYRDEHDAQGGPHGEVRSVEIHCVGEKQASRRCVRVKTAARVDVDVVSIR